MPPSKVIFLVCDGMADRPMKEKGNRTPLEAARTPNMDSLAADGVCGIMDPIGPGIRPGSDTAHLALLGYDPYKVYTGRGPFEAAGVGLELRPGDIAFRGNWATVDTKGRVTDRRAGRIKDGTKALAKALDGIKIDGVHVTLKAATEHRTVLVLHGSGISCQVSDTDPHKENLVAGCKALDNSPAAKRTCNVLNKFTEYSKKVLKDHPVNQARIKDGLPPANIVLARGAGMTPDMPPLAKLWGWKPIAIVGVALIRGICTLAGMDVPVVKGATGGVDTDMLAKARAAIKGLERHDLVFMNIKAPDIGGHDGNFDLKKSSIERIDEAVGYIKDNISSEVGLVITADHSTPVPVKNHAADPVPLLMYGDGVRTDNVKTFNEKAVAHGGLGRLRGKDLMPILQDWVDKAEKFGA
jgi:2,3-bisphosphoglycerate-independent phosphoglycerate mutase